MKHFQNGRLFATYDGVTPYQEDDFAGFGNTTIYDGGPVERYCYWDTDWNYNEQRMAHLKTRLIGTDFINIAQMKEYTDIAGILAHLSKQKRRGNDRIRQCKPHPNPMFIRCLVRQDTLLTARLLK